MDLSHPLSAVIPSLEGVVYEVLARTNTPLSGSRIAELARSGSNPGVRTALKRLVGQGTVIVRSAGPSLLYSANREHVLWPAIEAAVRASDGFLDELSDRIRALAEEWREPLRMQSGPGRAPSEATIALFGSVARGTSDASSDVDVVAVFPTPGITDNDERLVDELRSKVPMWTGNACNVYAASAERLNELIMVDDPIIRSWITEAVTLHGPDLRTTLIRSQARLTGG
jgi:predicted nucleotidyltransferase